MPHCDEACEVSVVSSSPVALDELVFTVIRDPMTVLHPYNRCIMLIALYEFYSVRFLICHKSL